MQWRTLRFLYGFSAPAPEVRDCWRTQDLFKIGHTLQTGSFAHLIWPLAGVFFKCRRFNYLFNIVFFPFTVNNACLFRENGMKIFIEIQGMMQISIRMYCTGLDVLKN